MCRPATTRSISLKANYRFDTGRTFFSRTASRLFVLAQDAPMVLSTRRIHFWMTWILCNFKQRRQHYSRLSFRRHVGSGSKPDEWDADCLTKFLISASEAGVNANNQQCMSLPRPVAPDHISPAGDLSPAITRWVFWLCCV